MTVDALTDDDRKERRNESARRYRERQQEVAEQRRQLSAPARDAALERLRAAAVPTRYRIVGVEWDAMSDGGYTPCDDLDFLGISYEIRPMHGRRYMRAEFRESALKPE